MTNYISIAARTAECISLKNAM